MRISAGAFSDVRQLQAIETLIAQDPARIGLRFGRAVCLEDLGRTREAIEAYTDVLDEEPTHFGALTNLGSLLLERGHAAAARSYMSTAAELQPEDPIALVNMGHVQAELGDGDAAIAAYMGALRIRPDSLHAHLGLARVYARRGNAERAQTHLDLAYMHPRSWTYAYHGQNPPLKVLVLASSSGGDMVCNQFFDNTVVQVTVLLADSVRAAIELPEHDLIFNAVGDADRSYASLERAAAICATSAAPVINDPRAVAATGRVQIMQRLRGLPGVRAPLTVAIARDELSAEALLARGFSFPLLLRSPGYHAGMHLSLVESPDVLKQVAATLPGSELLAIEYLDAYRPDGNVRKFRVVRVAGRLLPVHIAIASQWKVHYYSAQMAERAEFRTEEAAALADPAAAIGARGVHALESIFNTLNLDYAGVDFGLDADGNILVFEANATMAIYLPEADETWIYRRTASDRVLATARAMVIDRARAYNSYRSQGGAAATSSP